MAYRHFEFIEKHVWTLGILTAIMVSIGGLAEITPLFMAAHTVKPAEGVKPYGALRLAGNGPRPAGPIRSQCGPRRSEK